MSQYLVSFTHATKSLTFQNCVRAPSGIEQQIDDAVDARDEMHSHLRDAKGYTGA